MSVHFSPVMYFNSIDSSNQPTNQPEWPHPVYTMPFPQRAHAYRAATTLLNFEQRSVPRPANIPYHPARNMTQHGAVRLFQSSLIRPTLSTPALPPDHIQSRTEAPTPHAHAVPQTRTFSFSNNQSWTCCRVLISTGRTWTGLRGTVAARSTVQSRHGKHRLGGYSCVEV